MMKYNNFGIGSVVIPSDTGREKYINRVYELGICAIYVDEVGIITNAIIGESVMNRIKFPATSDEYGSMVFFMKTGSYNNYVITDTIKKANDINPFRENSFSHIRETGAKKVGIVGDSQSGTLSVSVDTDEKGTISISVDSRDGTSLYEVKVNGRTTMESDTMDMTIYDELSIKIPNEAEDDLTTIVYKKGTGLMYDDEFGNKISVNEDHVNIKAKKIIFGEGAEQLALGNTLKKLLDDFINQVSLITTVTAIGTQPIVNKATVEALKKRTEAILSELSYTD